MRQRTPIAILLLLAGLTGVSAYGAGDGARPAAPPGPHPAPDPGAQAILTSLLRRHAAYRDFKASFTETPVSRATGAGTEESGIVFFQRPGRWRWEYRRPERKVVIVNGKLATVSVEGEIDVARYDLAEADQGAGISSILDGGEHSAEMFSARFEGAEDPSPTSDVRLRLDPATLSDQFDYILVRVRRKDLALVAVTVVDPGGNELRFRFTDFRSNGGVERGLFDIPGEDRRPAGPPDPAPPEP